MSFIAIIPSRYASERLPGKALLDIAGKPLIQHVYERVLASDADRTIIATDDGRIAKVAKSFGAEVCMTAKNHRSGTERIAEAIETLNISKATIVINVQGDEPMLPPELIKQVATDLATAKDAEVATLCTPIKNNEEIFNPNVCKVVIDINGYALLFSRAPIPWDRKLFTLLQRPTGETLPLAESSATYRHIGLYAYRAGFVLRYVKLPVSDLERIESLEQLRVLYNDYKIHVAKTNLDPGIGVDTEDELQKVRELLSNIP